MTAISQISLGIAVCACREHAQTNPELRAATTLQKSHGIEVTMLLSSLGSFTNKYPETNPEMEIVLYHGGKRYASVNEFKKSINLG
jgi:hypothetical protein